MPFHGDVRSAPVPGCVDGWLALHERFGRLPLDRVLAAAVGYADDGFPASPLLAAAQPLLDGVAGADDLVGDRPLRPGDRRPPAGRRAARSRPSSSTGRDGFYEGEFGDGLLRARRRRVRARRPGRARSPTGSSRSGSPAWGHDLWTIPPNSPGLPHPARRAPSPRASTLPDDPDDGAWAHLLVEAARAAGHDRPAVLHEGADVAGAARAATRSAAGGRSSTRTGATTAPHRRPPAAGPCTSAPVDADGMAVSLIQSNASGFGSLVFEPATGIGLHNRGIGFNLDLDHPACYGPGRRPPHTLSPALVTRPDGSLRAVVGTMGGDSQPQILLQVLCRLLRHGESAGPRPSAPPAGRSPARTGFDTWTTPPGAARCRSSTARPPAWARGLEQRGHRSSRAGPEAAHGFGHAHLIAVTGAGWAGASDPRALVGGAVGY